MMRFRLLDKIIESDQNLLAIEISLSPNGNYTLKLAEVPGAAWVNLQPDEHLKNVSFSF